MPKPDAADTQEIRPNPKLEKRTHRSFSVDYKGASKNAVFAPPSVRIDVAPQIWDSNGNQERANRGKNALFRRA